MELRDKKIGVAICGSFCTLSDCFSVLEELKKRDCELVPVMSFNAYSIDTRFGKAKDNIKRLEEICGRGVINTIEDAEPIGPKKMTDIMLVVNCTGNTLAKLAMSITDTPVTMAVKSHIRNSRPVLLNIATNDALAGAAKNISALMNYKNYYFVPMRQDDYRMKPTSLMSDFSRIPEALEEALEYRQLQPMIFGE